MDGPLLTARHMSPWCCSCCPSNGCVQWERALAVKACLQHPPREVTHDYRGPAFTPGPECLELGTVGGSLWEGSLGGDRQEQQAPPPGWEKLGGVRVGWLPIAVPGQQGWGPQLSHNQVLCQGSPAGEMQLSGKNQTAGFTCRHREDYGYML